MKTTIEKVFVWWQVFIAALFVCYFFVFKDSILAPASEESETSYLWWFVGPLLAWMLCIFTIAHIVRGPIRPKVTGIFGLLAFLGCFVVMVALIVLLISHLVGNF